MVDKISKSARSRTMANVKSKDTKPELIVRSILHRLGFRFRLHQKDMPGKPDIVLPKYKSVVFIHGCFWHQHKDCRRAERPTSNIEYWNAKLNKNIERDITNLELLKKTGWNVVTVWECELKKANIEKLTERLICEVTK